ncbi:MAG: glutaredoxin domain-containing protein [Rhodoferax sp.]|nr:glutaredoxin domain-containing protein [Rhodoferax sp.]
MINITMYSSAGCGYCQSAEHLLRRKGVSQIDKILVDQEPGAREAMMSPIPPTDDPLLEPGAREAMMQKTGRRTVPQIYVGDFHVGGFDDLVTLDKAGKLDALLAQ